MNSKIIGTIWFTEHLNIQTNESLQLYKFEGKVLAAIEKIDNLRREDEPLGEGKDRTFGLDWYDIHARQYDAIGVPGWNKPDQLAEKYYGISPYSYCAGNPVNLGDYDGRDVWTIDENGNVQRDSWDKMDMILYSRAGKYVAKSYFEYGTIDGVSAKDGGYIFNLGSNDTAAKEVFETAADNSDVEWGLIEAFNREDGSSVNNVATSCSSTNENNSCNSVKQSNYYIGVSRHSHPSGNPIPSGIRERDTHGDKFVALQIESLLPEGETCSFAVYVPKERIKNGISYHDKVPDGYYYYNGTTTLAGFLKQYFNQK